MLIQSPAFAGLHCSEYMHLIAMGCNNMLRVQEFDVGRLGVGRLRLCSYGALDGRWANGLCIRMASSVMKHAIDEGEVCNSVRRGGQTLSSAT